MEDLNPELESFRQQWQAEVSARSKSDKDNKPHAGPSKQSRRPGFARLLSTSEGTSSTAIDGSEEPDWSPISPGPNKKTEHDHHVSQITDQANLKEPHSALEHYEKAVEREGQGKLGDSLNLYRKAFHMDHRVDKTYKNKYFPASSSASNSATTNTVNSYATVSGAAQQTLNVPPLSAKDLFAGFAGLSIDPAPPEIEGHQAPPCPLATLPEEILIHILIDLAVLDVASFVRLSQVCKKMAYVVSTEEQIWKRVCQDSEVGFGAMHYQWHREVLGGPLNENDSDGEDSDTDNHEAAVKRIPLSNDAITESLLQSVYSSSWHQMFRLRPRIRFNGCYISTVNYIRTGQAAPSQLTWSNPVHIVTYFRYLRFFRDGTVISLLSTSEPADVVPHITKELQVTHRGGASSHLPSSVMQYALRGRWRLSSVNDDPQTVFDKAEGDVLIETEGVNTRYLYRMKLALRSAGKGTRNNKLAWKGFWSYNIITDDIGDFSLRNDKAFFWSRVKSYGMGA